MYIIYIYIYILCTYMCFLDVTGMVVVSDVVKLPTREFRLGTSPAIRIYVDLNPWQKPSSIGLQETFSDERSY